MNYIAHLNAFRIRRLLNPLSSHGIALYFALMEYNNMIGWPERFTVANTILQGYASLSRNALNLARNELVLKGYLAYKKGTGNQCGTYSIVRFNTQTDTQSDTQDDSIVHSDTQMDIQLDTQSDTQTVHSSGTLDKPNQTKPNQTSDIPNVISLGDFRRRYTSEQQGVIDKFLDILRYTRRGGKIADSVIADIYKSWEVHPPEKVIYGLQKYIDNPGLHDKKENYVLGIIRNTTASEMQDRGRAHQAKQSQGDDTALSPNTFEGMKKVLNRIKNSNAEGEEI